MYKIQGAIYASYDGGLLEVKHFQRVRARAHETGGRKVYREL